MPDHPREFPHLFAGKTDRAPETGGVTPRATAPSPPVTATPPAEPRMTPTLGYLVRQIQALAPPMARDVVLPSYLRREANSALQVYDHVIRPVPARTMRDWLDGVHRPLAPQQGANFATWCADCSLVLEKLPASVFHSGTRAEALKKFTRFLPTPGELYELLNSHAAPLAATRRALARLLDTTEPSPPPSAELSSEERRKIAAEFHEQVIEAMGGETPPKPEPIRGHVSEAQLIAAYCDQARSPDALVSSIAKYRLRMLGVNPDAPPPPEGCEELR